jgi:hypothetical protein
MPRLVKGGKWAYGWVSVGGTGGILLPPDARTDYGFREGDEIALLPGSRRSGGFAVARADTLPEHFRRRALGHGRIERGFVVSLPPALAVPGARLLAVRGSGLALGFVARGPIYAEALRHGELSSYAVPKAQASRPSE